MGFRFRLASFVVAALVVVQGLTAVLVYQVAKSELIGEGQRQLEVAATAFVRQLDEISRRVAESVNVLAQDFALRSAIAQHDAATLLSALRNHGRRVGATQMFLVGVDSRIEADTRGEFAAGSPFPYGDLVEGALDRPASAIVAMDGGANWMVVVPVFAPNLVGFIAAAIPVDDRLLAQLQDQSTLPKRIDWGRICRASEVSAPITWRRTSTSSRNASYSSRLTASSYSSRWMPALPSFTDQSHALSSRRASLP